MCCWIWCYHHNVQQITSIATETPQLLQMYFPNTPVIGVPILVSIFQKPSEATIKTNIFQNELYGRVGLVWVGLGWRVGLGEVRKGVVGVWKICLLGQCFAPQHQELACCQNFTSPSSLTFLLVGLLHLQHLKVLQWFFLRYSTRTSNRLSRII